MMDDQITADFSTLLEQASMTAHTYMCSAVRDIDQCFGDGYSSEHPELVASYMKVAASDFNRSSNMLVWQGIFRRLADSHIYF